MEELAERLHERCHVVLEVLWDIDCIQRVEDLTKEVCCDKQCFEGVLVVDVGGNSLHTYLKYMLDRAYEGGRGIYHK